jgi:hypothetical protein
MKKFKFKTKQKEVKEKIELKEELKQTYNNLKLTSLFDSA